MELQKGKGLGWSAMKEAEAELRGTPEGGVMLASAETAQLTNEQKMMRSRAGFPLQRERGHE